MDCDNIVDLITFFDAKAYPNNELKILAQTDFNIFTPEQKITILHEIVERIVDNKYKNSTPHKRSNMEDLTNFGDVILNIFESLPKKTEAKNILQKMTKNNTFLITAIVESLASFDEYDVLSFVLPYTNQEAKDTALLYGIMLSGSPNLIRLLIYHGAKIDNVKKQLMDLIDKSDHQLNTDRVYHYHLSLKNCGCGHIRIRYYYDGNNFVVKSLCCSDEISQILKDIK